MRSTQVKPRSWNSATRAGSRRSGYAVRGRHVGRLAVMEGDGAGRDRAGDRAREIRLAAQQVALHVRRLAMRKHAVAMAAAHEVHAAVALVDVLERHPAGDPALVEVA